MKLKCPYFVKKIIYKIYKSSWSRMSCKKFFVPIRNECLLNKKKPNRFLRCKFEIWSFCKNCIISYVIFCFLLGALTKSQFPVFTIYAQKACLGVRPCARAWCVDRVQNYKLNKHAKRSVSVTSRRDCFELCLGETEFTCR